MGTKTTTKTTTKAKPTPRRRATTATTKAKTKAKPAAKKVAAKAPKKTIKTIIAGAPKAPIVVYSKDRKGEIRWTLYAKNRTIIAASSEGFSRKAWATRNFASTLKTGLVAELVDATRI